MLLTNQRLDKLAASRIDFQKRGMLKSSTAKAVPLEPPPGDDTEDAPGMTTLGDVKLAQTPGTENLN
jgi:hypothetical protein